MKSFPWRSQSRTNGKIIASATFGRSDIKMVMVSCNPKKYRKYYAWYVITLSKRTLEYAGLNGDVHFFCFRLEIPVLEKFSPKIQNSLFKGKFDA